MIGRPIGMITGFKVIGIFQTDAEVASSPKQDGAIQAFTNILMEW